MTGAEDQCVHLKASGDFLGATLEDGESVVGTTSPKLTVQHLFQMRAHHQVRLIGPDLIGRRVPERSRKVMVVHVPRTAHVDRGKSPAIAGDITWEVARNFGRHHARPQLRANTVSPAIAGDARH